jgi:hypothetical protein
MTVLPVIEEIDFEAIRAMATKDFPQSYADWVGLERAWGTDEFYAGASRRRVTPGEFKRYVEHKNRLPDLSALCALAAGL